MHTISSPAGNAYVSILDSHPDPDRRYVVRISDNYAVGLAGLTELAQALQEFVAERLPQQPVEPASAPKKRAPKGDQ